MKNTPYIDEVSGLAETNRKSEIRNPKLDLGTGIIISAMVGATLVIVLGCILICFRLKT